MSGIRECRAFESVGHSRVSGIRESFIRCLVGQAFGHRQYFSPSKTKSTYIAEEKKIFPPPVSSALAHAYHKSVLQPGLSHKVPFSTEHQFHFAVHIVIHQADLVYITKVGTKKIDIAKVRVRRRHINLLRVPTDRSKS